MSLVKSAVRMLSPVSGSFAAAPSVPDSAVPSSEARLTVNDVPDPVTDARFTRAGRYPIELTLTSESAAEVTPGASRPRKSIGTRKT